MALPGRIGRYLIVGELGRGAMGTVYRGRDEALEREVALKVMTKGATDPSARARFQREARAAARLQHPNIVVIYELGEHEGFPFIALELLEGVDLQQALEGGIRPDPRLVLPLVSQILAGLGHAHEHGIVHRDVKPSNVFLPLGQPAKIMDFGVARLADAATTATGGLTGTPSYMSPEQVSGEELDGRSDLFSVGLMLYELLTGEKAFRADTVLSILYKVVHEPPDLSLLPSAPEWSRLKGVLERTLARRPEDRYPDARAMSADVAAALAELGGSTPERSAGSDRLLLHRATRSGSGPRLRPDARATAASASAPDASSRRGSAAPRLAAGAALAGRPRWAVAASAAAATMLIGAGLLFWHARSAPTPSPTSSATPPSVAAARSPLPRTAEAPLPASPSALPLPAPAKAPPRDDAVGGPTGTGAPPDVPAAVAAPAVPAPPDSAEARLTRARDLLRRSRWAEALAEARLVLENAPRNAEAAALADQAESEIVIEQCLQNARAALREGDRERALDEVRRGFLVRTNDPRLLEMHRQVVQQ